MSKLSKVSQCNRLPTYFMDYISCHHNLSASQLLNIQNIHTLADPEKRETKSESLSQFITICMLSRPGRSRPNAPLN